jgi:hypothetical protein
MKSLDLQNRIGGAFLVFSLLFGIGIAMSSRVQAQNPDDRYAGERRNTVEQNQRGRNWELYGSYGGSTELRQTALNAGYNEGVSEARKDRGAGRAADLRGQSAYQLATKGYRPGMGDRDLYRRYFREAFENAYDSERYAQANGERASNYDNNFKKIRRGRNNDGYGNFGGSFQLRQTALNAGFNEGVKQGRSDRSKRNSGGFQNRKAYQSATKDYSSGLGDREVYQRYFREAYEHGYGDGYSTY